jgi:hypothetical protein
MYKVAEEQPQETLKMVSSHQFIGEGQKPTPVVTARGITELLNLIPGEKVKPFRRYCGEIIVRYMGEIIRLWMKLISML